MGVTIKCKKTGREMDVGYFGFFKLRTKVAELVGSEVGEHYKKLDDILDISICFSKSIFSPLLLQTFQRNGIILLLPFLSVLRMVVVTLAVVLWWGYRLFY